MSQFAYTVPEALKAAGYVVGRTEFYKILNSGALPARKYNRRTLILAEDLANWLRSLPSYKGA